MYRSLNSKQRDVLIQILLLANHEANEWEWGSDIFKCEPGQFITSLESLAKNCASDVKVQSVRSALLKLEKWGFLTNESTKTGRLITVCNWELYQHKESDTNKDTNRQPTKSQQTSNKELTTNKNEKNDNNDKELNVTFKFIWDLYDKKVGDKTKLEKKWVGLSDLERELIVEHVKEYKGAQPDKQYRKNFQTYLNNRAWEDEIIKRTEETKAEDWSQRESDFYNPDDFEDVKYIGGSK